MGDSGVSTGVSTGIEECSRHLIISGARMTLLNITIQLSKSTATISDAKLKKIYMINRFTRGSY